MSEPEVPDFFGAVTVGERGQVVIPLAAREALNIKSGDKLLVVGKGLGGPGLLLLRADAVTQFLARAVARLSGLERVLDAQQADEAGEASDERD